MDLEPHTRPTAQAKIWITDADFGTCPCERISTYIHIMININIGTCFLYV